MQHAADAHHHFRKEDIRILSRKNNWHDRGIKESLYIHGLSPSLNRNEGRHQLPHCYDSIMKGFVKKPKPLDVHSADKPLLTTAKRPLGRPRTNRINLMGKTAPKSIEDQNNKTVPKTAETHHMVTRSRRAREEGGGEHL